MARPVSWYRVWRGKVWHVGFADDALAACGYPRPDSAETVGERAPVNARVCGDCVLTALHLYALAQAGQMGDPRKTFDPCAAAGETILAVEGCDESANQIPADVTSPPPAQTVDLVAALRGSIEAARERRLASDTAEPDDEWPCGGCGHPNLDHDCDDGTCTVTNDDPGVSWAECPCRGLKRAG